MKTVLCFGDSNTWGFIPGTDWERHEYADRWPGVVAGAIGEDWLVVECGLSGRTTVWDDPMMSERCGKVQLPSVLDTHMPLDLVVIMLGTNDLKHHFGVDAGDIAGGAGCLVEMVLESSAGPGKAAPQVLLVAPPAVTPASAVCGYQFVDAVEKSLEFPKAYWAVAEELGCAFFDAATVVEADDGDGLHLSAESHHRLGAALVDQIKRF